MERRTNLSTMPESLCEPYEHIQQGMMTIHVQGYDEEGDIISLFTSSGLAYTIHRRIFTKAVGKVEDVKFPLVLHVQLNDRDITHINVEALVG